MEKRLRTSELLQHINSPVKAHELKTVRFTLKFISFLKKKILDISPTIVYYIL